MTNIKILKFILIAMTFALFATSCKPKEQNPCGFVQNVYGQRISWKTREPIEIVINDAVPAQLRPAIYRAAATWEKQIGQKIFNVTEISEHASPAPGKDGKNGIYFLSDWEADRKSEQGRTSVYWAADQIMEADIRINAADFSFYDKDPDKYVMASGHPGTVNAFVVSDVFNFEALVLHELGHFIGLKHTTEAGSVMVTHLAAKSDRTVLSESDVQSVKCVYN
jgi:hypothetical protein